MRAIGYIRVSTAAQEEDGASLPAQKNTLVGEASRRGWEIDFAQDAASGGSMKRRPGLASALERLDAGEYGALMVIRADRLSRSSLDFAMILERARDKGWAVVCLDPAVDMSTPYGEAMAQMAAVFAQLERRLISERIKEALAQKRRDGTLKLTPPRVSEEVARMIVGARERGESYRNIARTLEMRGIPAPGGPRWHHYTIQQVYARSKGGRQARGA